MEVAKKIDIKLEEFFKGVPHLSDSTRTTLANIWPWFALVGGLFQLAAAKGLYDLLHIADNLDKALGSLAIYTTGSSAGPSSFDKNVIYLGIAMVVVDAVILLIAFPKLRSHEKAGWNLIFLAALVNVVYSVVQIFTFNQGFSSFLGGLIGSAIGFYLLYEVKAKFNK